MIRDTFAVRNMSGDLNDNKRDFEHLHNHTADEPKAEHAANHSTAKAHPKTNKDVATVEPPPTKCAVYMAHSVCVAK